MMRVTVTFALAAVICAVLTVELNAADIISVNFTQNDSLEDIGAGESAGYLAVSNWNNAPFSKSGTEVFPGTIVNSLGTPTTVGLRYSGTDARTDIVVGSGPNSRLYKGIAPCWGVNNRGQDTCLGQIELSNLNTNIGGLYSVYLYIGAGYLRGCDGTMLLGHTWAPGTWPPDPDYTLDFQTFMNKWSTPNTEGVATYDPATGYVDASLGHAGNYLFLEECTNDTLVITPTVVKHYDWFDGASVVGVQLVRGPVKVSNTGSATGITANAAWVRGTLVSYGVTPADVRVYYGTTDGTNSFTAWATNVLVGTDMSPATFAREITDLQSDSMYFYRCYATNSGGEDDWADRSQTFLTPKADGTGNVWIVASDPHASETAPDTGMFTVHRSSTVAAISGPLPVYYSVSGTASNGTDYAALTGAVVLAAGSATVDIPVIPEDDLDYGEGDAETVILTLGPGAYVVSNNNVGARTVTIADNDVPPPVTTEGRRTISVNFTIDDGSQDIGPREAAGLVGARNWNNAPFSRTGTQIYPGAIVDDLGASTAVTLRYHGTDARDDIVIGTNANSRLYRGRAPCWGVNNLGQDTCLGQIEFSNLVSVLGEEYDVYLYIGSGYLRGCDGTMLLGHTWAPGTWPPDPDYTLDFQTFMNKWSTPNTEGVPTYDPATGYVDASLGHAGNYLCLEECTNDTLVITPTVVKHYDWFDGASVVGVQLIGDKRLADMVLIVR